MTPIEVGVNPKRALQRRSQHAEEFLQKYGFVRGQHFQDEQQALKLATQVQIELEIRSLRGGEGFFDVSTAYCEYKLCSRECRGWDGASQWCECGEHWVEVKTSGSYPTASYEVVCTCCVECGNGQAHIVCEVCERQFCARCERGHRRYDDCE